MAQQPLVQEWLNRSIKFQAENIKEIEKDLEELDAHLLLRTYIVGYGLTEADTAVFKEITQNRRTKSVAKQGKYRNIQRWYTFIEETNPDLAGSVATIRSKGLSQETHDSYEIGLQDTEKGIVTRFPPEPS
jgi:glutamyl-tRNA synthetase